MSISYLWEDYIRPMLQRPRRLQVAALCTRDGEGGKKVLLVTSRGTGRWIIPKGWPIRGMASSEAAMQEAWEEAGVCKGQPSDSAIGTYTYQKTTKHGWPVPVETLVFPVTVEKTAEDFPEAHQRQRKWVDASDAANMVNEPELKLLIREYC